MLREVPAKTGQEVLACRLHAVEHIYAVSETTISITQYLIFCMRFTSSCSVMVFPAISGSEVPKQYNQDSKLVILELAIRSASDCNIMIYGPYLTFFTQT